MKVSRKTLTDIVILMNKVTKRVDKGRSTINGVLIDKDEKSLVATDGIMLAKIPLAEEVDKRVFISAEYCRQLDAILKQDKTTDVFDISFALREDNFPKYSTIYPKYCEESTVEVRFNAALLKDLAEAMAKTEGLRNPIVTLKFSPSNTQQAITVIVTEQVQGLLMPCRK